MASYYGGVTLSREQAAQVAYQAGFRGETLVQMVAIAGRESSYVSGAHRTDSQRSRLSGDRGLWQINYIWDDDLRAAGIIRSAQDLFDPLTNARAAMFVFQRQGLDAWAMGSSGYQSGGNPFKATDVSAASAAVARAGSQGLLGQDWQSGATASAAATPSGGAAGGGGGSLPADARLIRTENGVLAAFKIADGVGIYYGNVSAAQMAGRHIENMSAVQVHQTYGALVAGGDASELAEIPTAFGSYNAYLNAILDQIFPAGDPRRNDPEIMRVLATRAGRPDMTEAEFENLLKATQYYQSRTEGQLRWNDLSESERNLQRRDTEARISQIWLQYVGREFTAEERRNIGYWVEQVASGQWGFGELTENHIKRLAAQYSETPWSRQLREEQENQRQRPVDIENTMGQVRETLTRWGLKWSEQTIGTWARELIEKTKSDDDLLNTIKQSAQVLYPWKDPEMETVVAAAPWIETYNRVLERQGSLQTPEIARVLSAYGRDPDNNDVWSFEQKLRMSDARDQTREGQDEAWSTVGELAGVMGF